MFVLAFGGLTASAAGEAAYFEDLPTVLTASRLPQPLNEAPGAVTVIEGELIRATGYRDLARVFRLVPGMQIGQERGNSYWVTYHGLGANFPSELQVLVDGRSIYSMANFGGVDWTTLPVSPEEIDRIEVVRGPNAVSYGANAFMGVINIITYHAAQNPINRVRGSVGNAQLKDLDGLVSTKAGGAAVQLAASSKHDTGFTNLHDSRRVKTGSLRSDWRVSNRDELTLRLAASSARRGDGYEDSLFNSVGPRDTHSDAQSVHVKWAHTPAADAEILVQAYHNQESFRDAWTAAVPAGFPYGPSSPDVNRNRKGTRDQVEFQSRNSSVARQTVWGAEARRDTVDAPFMYAAGNPEPTDLYRLFGNLDERLTQSLNLNFGAALEKYRGEPAHLAPRAFLNWQVESSQTLRLGGARAWGQRPTFEKEGDTRVIDPATGALLVHHQPNPDLRQARIDSMEIGYLGRFKPFASSLDVRIFRERVRDYIARFSVNSPATAALEPWIGSLQYQNFSRPVVLQGAEYQAKFKPWTGANIIFNHAMIDRRSGDENIDDRIAPYTATLAWQQRWTSHWSSMISAARVGPMAGADGIATSEPYVAKAYTSFDARIAWASRWASGGQYEISLSAINLGKRHQEIPDRGVQAYRSILGDTAPANSVSRTVYLSLASDF
ncbi:TonB-dependent receptor [Uliginosibacterium flavum]